VGAVLFLILVGGIVRSTGSGMGCPDWPKCFGLFVPPTEVSEIPAAFFEKHPEYESKTFNAVQTWIEYLNRLLGALIGLFTLATAVLSFVAYRRKDKRIVVLSVLALFLTGFEGWLGKLVVDKNLQGGMVTIHMLVAIIIVGMLITAVYLSTYATSGVAPQGARLSSTLKWLGVAVVGLTVAQILFGTQVREQVDVVGAAMAGAERGKWLDQMDWQYGLHRVLWIALAGASVVWAKGLMQTPNIDRRVVVMAVGMLICLGIEVLLGVLLSSFALPRTLQPLHLLFATVLFSLEYAVLIYAFGVERLFAGKNSPMNALDRGAILNAKH
jgi:heme a synthase